MQTRWAWVAAVTAGLLVGCGGRLPAVEHAGGYAAAGTEYGQLLPRYTREAELYDGFDTVAKGVATWRTLELVQAAAATSAARYHLDEAAGERLREEQALLSQTAQEFHLALYIPEKQLNDLESTGSLWRAYLLAAGGERLEPLTVEFLRKSDKSRVEYPYVTPWTREYRLRFPLLPGDAARQPVTLVLTGPLGTLRFAF